MTPYPSTRLEVIRDGIEDYEYLALLKRTLESARKRPEQERPSADLLAQAQALLSVPDSISQTMTEFTKDPARISGRRQAVGDMIETLLGGR